MCTKKDQESPQSQTPYSIQRGHQNNIVTMLKRHSQTVYSTSLRTVHRSSKLAVRFKIQPVDCPQPWHELSTTTAQTECPVTLFPVEISRWTVRHYRCGLFAVTWIAHEQIAKNTLFFLRLTGGQSTASRLDCPQLPKKLHVECCASLTWVRHGGFRSFPKLVPTCSKPFPKNSNTKKWSLAR